MVEEILRYIRICDVISELYCVVMRIRILLRRTDGANIIHTVKTTWPSQHALFELLTFYPYPKCVAFH